MNVQELIDVYEERRDALEEIGEQVQQCEDAIESFDDSMCDAYADLAEEQTDEDPSQSVMDELNLYIEELRQKLGAAMLDLKRLRLLQTDASNDLDEVTQVLDHMDRYTNNPTLRCEHWKLPGYLIPDDELADYAYDTVRDCYGELPHWVVVDWRATGEALTQDMTSIEWEGNEYWFN